MKRFLNFSFIFLLVFSQFGKAQVLVDPTLPKAEIITKKNSKKISGVADKSKPAPLVLQSIMRGSNKNTVVISGKSYQLGDTVRGMKLTQIRDRSVELSTPSKTITLSMTSYEIKKS